MAKETTPLKITQIIRDMCTSIAPDSTPVFVAVHPEPWAVYRDCFSNVLHMIQLHGGVMVLGWTIWQWGNILLDAEAHAIWQSPDGKLVDITPHSYQETSILFLQDSSVNYHEAPIPNHRQALTQSPLVAKLIQLHNQQDAIMCSCQAMDFYTVPADLVRHINAIHIYINRKVGRNDPCPCGSGLKYKKCCGPFE